MSKDSPDNDSAAYRPVNCAFHDVLEAAVTLRKPVTIVMRGAGGATSSSTARIMDVYSKEGVEYITLDSGETVRLDALEAVGGISASQFD